MKNCCRVILLVLFYLFFSGCRGSYHMPSFVDWDFHIKEQDGFLSLEVAFRESIRLNSDNTDIEQMSDKAVLYIRENNTFQQTELLINGINSRNLWINGIKQQIDVAAARLNP